MDNKRLLIAFVLCGGILFAWSKFFPTNPPAPEVTTAVTPTPGTPGAPGPTAAAAPNGATPAAAAAPVVPLSPEQRLVLETTDARFVFTTRGAALRQVKLKDPKFRLKKGDAESGEEIIRTASATTAPLRVAFHRAQFPWPSEVDWTASQPRPDQVVFTHEGDQVRIEKRYTALAERYRLRLEVTVTNKTDKPQVHDLAVSLYGAQDPERKGGGFLDYASANLAEMACDVDGTVERKNVEDLAKESKDFTGAIRWVSADEKFTTLAMVAPPSAVNEPRRCAMRTAEPNVAEVSLNLPTRTVAPTQSTAYLFEVFAGPKYREDLGAVRIAGFDPELDKLVNVTFAVLSRPMLALLKVFHGFTMNWGLAIILLTIVVKLITFYPAHRALMSGKKMARLQPKIAELRKKHESDRERLGKETMAMYKENGVNMFGGCLPSLIQMPIWIALFSTLNHSVELYRAGFFGYIQDLSARDPYFITPLIMGVVMSIQMRMTPAGADPQQQKMMAVMMPIMFTAFSLFLPAGLAIYTLTNYLLGIVHQLIVNRIDRHSNGSLGSSGPALATGKPAKA